MATSGSERQDILQIRSLSVQDPNGKRQILRDITARVPVKGLTAVLGPSASGKTVLLKTLSGINKSLPVTGNAELFGKSLDFKRGSPQASYVPKEDRLIGDLTSLETLLYSIRMRTSLDKHKALELAGNTLKQFGLYHVKDTIVGTIIKRGLSGGEKRRLAVAMEFCVRPDFLFLDEPTSGLDTAAAINLVQTLKDAVDDDKQALQGVLLSIHQPNHDLLQLFDCILVLGQAGAPTYFGSVDDVGPYFEDMGFPLPSGHTATDFILEVTSPHRGASGRGTDFYAAWTLSGHRERLVDAMEARPTAAAPAAAPGDGGGGGGLLPATGGRRQEGEEGGGGYGFARRVGWIAHREFVLARRDVTLYWFQWATSVMFGFLVGATFWDMPWDLDASMAQLNNGLIWLLMIMCYMHVFKATYLDAQNKRCELERGNEYYGALTFFWADVLCVNVMNLYQVSPVLLAYFMCGYPTAGFGPVLLLMYLMTLSSEAMAKIVSLVSPSTAYSVVILQSLIVAMNIFPGGMVLSSEHIPVWWGWAEQLSLYVRSYEPTLALVYDHMTFECPPDMIDAESQACLNFGVGDGVYPCDHAYDFAAGVCEVDGRTALEVQTGISANKEGWPLFGYLLLYYVGLKALVLLCTYVDVPDMLLQARHRLCFPGRGGAAIDDNTRSRRVVFEGEEEQEGWPLGGPAGEEQEGLPATRRAHAPKMKATFPAAMEEGKEDLEEVGGATIVADLRTPNASPKPEAAAAGGSARKAPQAGSGSLRRPGLSSQKSSYMRAKVSNLYFEDITVTLKKKKNPKILVDKVTACARGGRPLFLMGPSGAGKTTLLNALSGRLPYAEVTGRVLLDGKPVARDRLAYVEQFDEILGVFSIREHLVFRGRVLGVPEEDLQARVDELLEILGFTGKEHRRTAGLTSGELKRVSVGLGMVGKPDVLFLDEPTTGLDSDNSANVMRYIAKVARHTGTVTICTIHQPSKSVFDLSEDFLLLCRGRTAYYGATADCAPYFAALGLEAPARANPADFYLDLLKGPPGDRGLGAGAWGELYPDRRPAAAVELLRLAAPKTAAAAAAEGDGKGKCKEGEGSGGTLRKLGVLTRKTLVYYWREPAAYPVRAAELLVMGLFIGTVFFRLKHRTDWMLELTGAFFFEIWCLLFSTMAAAPVYVRVRRQVLQEVLAGAYPMWMSSAAQAVASLLFNGVIALGFQAVVHFLVHFGDSASVFGYLVLLAWQLLLLMEGLCLMVCEVLKHDVLAVTFTMLSMGFFVLYAGFFVQVEDMPPAIGTWIPYMLPLRSVMAGCLNNIFGSIDIQIEGTDNYLDKEGLIEDVFGYPMASKWNFFALNFIWIVFFRFAHLGVCMFTLRSYKR